MQVDLSPVTVLSVLGILGGVISGLLYLIGVFGSTRQHSKKDNLKIAKDAADFVTDSLEKKVKVLEQALTDQAKQILDMSNQLHQLIGENKILKDLLQGRDENTQLVQQLGMDVMTKTVPLLVETTTKTNENVERLAEAIEKHLVQMGKKQVVTVTTGTMNGQT